MGQPLECEHSQSITTLSGKRMLAVDIDVDVDVEICLSLLILTVLLSEFRCVGDSASPGVSFDSSTVRSLGGSGAHCAVIISTVATIFDSSALIDR